MIDCHSHIIYGIDDGCKIIEDSIETIKRLHEIGFDKLILTPHYMKGSNYIADNEEKEKRLNEIREKLLEEKIDVDLYLGNEIYITDNIDELIKKDKISKMNNTKYILVELPLYNKLNNAADVFYELRLLGYQVILAHPERYLYIQKNYAELKPLLEAGVLLQSNYGSVIGNYGKGAKKLVKYLLKKNLVTFMATDIHRPTYNIIDKFKIIKRIIIRWSSKEKFEELTNDNILKIINGEEIERK